jgi:hypothetical protein
VENAGARRAPQGREPGGQHAINSPINRRAALGDLRANQRQIAAVGPCVRREAGRPRFPVQRARRPDHREAYAPRNTKRSAARACSSRTTATRGGRWCGHTRRLRTDVSMHGMIMRSFVRRWGRSEERRGGSTFPRLIVWCRRVLELRGTRCASPSRWPQAFRGANPIARSATQPETASATLRASHCVLALSSRLA